MPNIKSAKKRVLVTEKKNALNKSVKSELATLKKKFLSAVEEKNVDAASALLSQVTSAYDTAAGNNVISANCASRNKSALSKKLDSIKK